MPEEDENGVGPEGCTPDEVQRLRQENLALKERLEAEGKKRRGGLWTGFFVWLLVVLGCVSAFGATFSVWLRATALDTGAFVDTVAPLVKEEAVARAVSDEAVEILFERVDVSGNIEEALPDDLDFIADPVTTGLKATAQTVAQKILQSDQFQAVWRKVLELSHGQAVRLITGTGGMEVSREGEVVLNISELLESLRDELVDQGVDILKNVSIPENAGRVVLFEARQLGLVKHAVDLLDTLRWILPFFSMICFTASVAIADDRRRVLMVAGIGLAVTFAAVLIALDVTRTELLKQVESPVNREAGLVIWDHLVSGLRGIDFALLFLGLMVGLGAALAGPYKWAVWLRDRTNAMFSAWRRRRDGAGREKGPVLSFVTEHTWGVRVAGLAAAVLVLLVWPGSSGLQVLIIAGVLLLYMVIIELLR